MSACRDLPEWFADLGFSSGLAAGSGFTALHFESPGWALARGMFAFVITQLGFWAMRSGRRWFDRRGAR